jgi:hypothetical protein
MARKPVRKSMVAIAFAVVALLLNSTPASAQDEVEITTSLTALNPLTGTFTGDSDGTGKAKFELAPEEGQICYKIKVRGIQEPTEPAPGVGSAHIHFTEGGGIAVDLAAKFQRTGDDGFKATRCVEVDQELLSQIIADPMAFYVNIHNIEFPDGALFGVL